MSGIVINIEPVLIRLGSLELRWYSIAIMAAVFTGIIIAARESKRKGLPIDEIYSLAIWVVIAGIIGARLFHVLDKWKYYVDNPLQIIQMNQGGLAIWGGVLGGMVAAVTFAKIKHLSIARLLDAAVPALLTAQIVGRFGCIINGDAYGGISNLPWSFIYIHPDALIPAHLSGVPTHPYPVYEMAWNTMALLLILILRRKVGTDGASFLIYIGLYSLGRFMLSFFRQENTIFWHLQQAQLVAIAILIIVAIIFIYVKKKQPTIISSET